MPTSMTVAAGFYPIAFDHFRSADSGDDNVSAAHDAFKVAGSAVSDGDCAILGEQ